LEAVYSGVFILCDLAKTWYLIDYVILPNWKFFLLILFFLVGGIDAFIPTVACVVF